MKIDERRFLDIAARFFNFAQGDICTYVEWLSPRVKAKSAKTLPYLPCLRIQCSLRTFALDQGQ